MDGETFTMREMVERHRSEVRRLYTEGRLDELHTKEQCERAYRRGYRDGFIEAVNAYYDLMRTRLSKNEAYSRCWDHWEKMLAEWETGNCSGLKLPPAVKTSRQGEL